MMSPSSVPVLLLLLGAALAAPGLLARASSDAVAQRLGKEIEDVRAAMINGREDLGIPVCEPLVIETIPIEADSGILKATGSLDNLHIDGLSTFTVSTLQQTSGTARSGRVALEVYVPATASTTEYDLRGKLKLGFISVNLSGKSAVTAKVTGIRAGADLDITLNDDGSVTVDNISNVHYRYDSAKVHVDAMNDLVNGLINKIIPTVLQSNEKTIKQLIATLGKENINKYFAVKAGKTPVRTIPVAEMLALAAEHFVMSEQAQRLFMQILLAA